MIAAPSFLGRTAGRMDWSLLRKLWMMLSAYLDLSRLRLSESSSGKVGLNGSAGMLLRTERLLLGLK